MSKKVISIMLGLLAINLLILPAFVLAQTSNITVPTIPGLPTGTSTTTPQTIIVSIINLLLGFLGLIAIILILVGGFRWMTAQGDEEKVKKAQGTLITGVVGLIIIISAYAIANYVVNTLLTQVVR